jgi:thioredoxin reductase
LRRLETGVLLSNDVAAQMGHLIANWTDKLTIFTNGPSKIDLDDMAKLEGKGIKVIDKLVTGFIHQNGKLSAIQLDDKEEWPLQVVYSHPLRIQHTGLPEKLGCKLTEHGLLEVNEFQLTTVPGIYAAGDNSTIFRAVSMAVSNGTMAGAMINKELVGL